MIKKKIEPALLNMEEFCAYLSIGETKETYNLLHIFLEEIIWVK